MLYDPLDRDAAYKADRDLERCTVSSLVRDRDQGFGRAMTLSITNQGRLSISARCMDILNDARNT